MPAAPPPIAPLFARDTGAPLRDAFPGKRAVPPFTGMQPLPPSATGATWDALRRQPRTGRSVAYVHVPFCENHCLFCGFYQNAWRPDRGGGYVDTVLAHLGRDADRAGQAVGPVGALYFGGGTPTALATDDLVRLVDGCRAYLPLAADCEITVEGRPHGLTPDAARRLFDAGVTRLSLGVQTFDDTIRRRMGRRATGTQVARLLGDLAALDRGAIVIDLMFGLPGQSPAVWRRDIDTALHCGLDGLDLYALNVIRGTPLETASASGKLRPAPAEALGAYFAIGADMLDRAGWQSVSAAHWRRTQRERNRYNRDIKSGASCLAFGAGAGGLLHGHSYRTIPDLAGYAAAVAAGAAPIAGMMRAKAHHRLLTDIRAGLETGRLHVAALETRLRGIGHAALVPPLRALVAQWARAGLLHRDPDRDPGRLTLAGRFWQVAMAQRLTGWLDAALHPATRPGAQPHTVTRQETAHVTD